MLISLAFLVGYDMLRGPTPADELVMLAGLPLLSSLDGTQTTSGAGEQPGTVELEKIRALALRLRQHLTLPRTVVLTVPAAADHQFDVVTAHLANVLARRDERVLILDSRLSPGEGRNVFPLSTTDESAAEKANAAAGLADYLTFSCDELTEFARFTSIPGVEYIGIGAASAPNDLLATHRMRELIEKLRDTYTLIFVIGPTVENLVDLEILAAHADGILLFLKQARQKNAALRSFLETMTELDAPLLGSIAVK